MNNDELNNSFNEEFNLNNLQKYINIEEKKNDGQNNKSENIYVKNKQRGKMQYKISAEKFRRQEKNYNEYDTIKTCFKKYKSE